VRPHVLLLSALRCLGDTKRLRHLKKPRPEGSWRAGIASYFRWHLWHDETLLCGRTIWNHTRLQRWQPNRHTTRYWLSCRLRLAKDSATGPAGATGGVARLGARLGMSMGRGARPPLCWACSCRNRSTWWG